MARNGDPSTMKSKIVKISTSLVISCLASQVFASGFQLMEQNVTNLGLAYSGTAALAEDASTGFYNAAGLTRIADGQVVLSGIGIQGDFDFTASRSIASLPTFLIDGFPIFVDSISVNGSRTDDPGTFVFVPALHIAKRLDKRWVFGFSVTTPYGLDSEYDEDGIARYVATNSSLQTMNFSPSLSYDVLPCLSIGVGGDAEWAKARLEARIGNGDLVNDGFQKNHAEAWGYGWHAGVLWMPRETTRIGLHYRSHINLDAEGYSENLSPRIPPFAPFGLSGGNFTYQKVHADVTLPETATFSFYHAFNEKFAMTGDVAWTNWERFTTLRLRFNPGAAVLDSTATSIFSPQTGMDTDTWEQWDDTFRYALGMIYTHNDCWLFRVGAAFDESPVSDEFRTARIPDSDRIWLALGGAYTFNSAWRIDFGYAHLFFDDATINDTAPFTYQSQTPITRAQLAGSYDSAANIFGIQIRYDFV